jgi:hypothetical protein
MYKYVYNSSAVHFNKKSNTIQTTIKFATLYWFVKVNLSATPYCCSSVLQ